MCQEWSPKVHRFLNFAHGISPQQEIFMQANFLIGLRRKMTVAIQTQTSGLPGQLCALCNTSYSPDSFSQVRCGHELCLRCRQMLEGIGGRPPVCPICKAEWPQSHSEE
jgi:hypothetical protein